MELEKARFLELSQKAYISKELYDDLEKKLGNIFYNEALPPENLKPRYKDYSGDNIIEPNLKYKNYYKKVFNPKQIISPFTASQIIPEQNKRIWIYLDQASQCQGPFSGIVMDNWYNKQLLPMDLLIGLADRERMVKLSDFIATTYPFDKNPRLFHTKKFTDQQSEEKAKEIMYTTP